MPVTLSFFLPIVPTPQARARHAYIAGHAVAYKSAAQRANETTLDAMLAGFRPGEPFHGAVRVFFTACFAPPKSASKRAYAAMLFGEIAHVKKPDVDNLAKNLFDAMSRMRFWDDDRQVIALSGEKKYAEAPGWHVVVIGA